MKEFISVITPENYIKYLKSRGLFKVIPKKFMHKLDNMLKPRVVSKYYEGSDKIGYSIGIFLKENISKEDYLKRLIDGINYLKTDKVKYLNIDELQCLNIDDITRIEKGTKLKLLDGKKVKVNTLKYVLNNICKHNNLNLVQKEILIIADKTKYTENIVLQLSKELKYISLLPTNENKSTNKLEEKVFKNTGLVLRVIDNTITMWNKYDIIINLSDEVDIESKKVQAKTIVFDLSRSLILSKYINRKRKDVLVVDNFIFKNKRTIISDKKEIVLKKEIYSEIYSFFNEKVDKNDCIKYKCNNKLFKMKDLSISRAYKNDKRYFIKKA